jgi:hypothetical protein
MNLKQKAPVPQVTRHIGTTERYVITFGHVIYAIITGLFVLVANTSLTTMQNIREFCAMLEEAPFDVNDHISAQNDVFLAGPGKRDMYSNDEVINQPETKDELDE